jgi:hypothetical protein
VTATATEQKFARLLASSFDVIIDSLSSLLRQLTPDGSTGLLLPHCGAIDRIPARCNIFDPKRDNIAAPLLTIDCVRGVINGALDVLGLSAS